jgi:hypothetical protein
MTEDTPRTLTLTSFIAFDTALPGRRGKMVYVGTMWSFEYPRDPTAEEYAAAKARAVRSEDTYVHEDSIRRISRTSSGTMIQLAKRHECDYSDTIWIQASDTEHALLMEALG